jgi:anaerobic selenocysteine-containing dehydrogenase
MAKKTKFRPGDIVRVVGERGTAKVRAVLKDVNGALLQTKLAGYRNWNLDELELVERTNLKSRKVSDAARTKLREFWSRRKKGSPDRSGAAAP